MDNDAVKTVLVYIGIIILIIITFMYIIPLLFGLIGLIISFLVKVIMWCAVIYILFLMVKYLYENFNQK